MCVHAAVAFCLAYFTTAVGDMFQGMQLCENAPCDGRVVEEYPMGFSKSFIGIRKGILALQIRVTNPVCVWMWRLPLGVENVHVWE